MVPIWPFVLGRFGENMVLVTFMSETPAIMQVCHEAREECQKLDIYKPRVRSPIHRSYIWIKPGIDILCPVRHGRTPWTFDMFLNFKTLMAKLKIKRIALDKYRSPDCDPTSGYDIWGDKSLFRILWKFRLFHEVITYNSSRQFNILRQPLILSGSPGTEHGLTWRSHQRIGEDGNWGRLTLVAPWTTNETYVLE